MSWIRKAGVLVNVSMYKVLESGEWSRWSNKLVAHWMRKRLVWEIHRWKNFPKILAFWADNSYMETHRQHTLKYRYQVDIWMESKVSPFSVALALDRSLCHFWLCIWWALRPGIAGRGPRHCLNSTRPLTQSLLPRKSISRKLTLTFTFLSEHLELAS